MGKGFLHLKIDKRRRPLAVLVIGMTVTLILGVRSLQAQSLTNGSELLRKEAGEGSYQQEVIAWIEGERILMQIPVEEQLFTEQEAKQLLEQAVQEVDLQLKADNSGLSQVMTELRFADTVCDGLVEVEWVEKASDYFYSDGVRKEETMLLEPLECSVSAVLRCQGYERTYEAEITLLPKEPSMQEMLLKSVQEEKTVVKLPKQYEGHLVTWKKPMDLTFVYFGLLTAAGAFFLKMGEKQDEQQEKEHRKELLEQEYAQIVSKFTMLLSAGLSIRNAWERIVGIAQERTNAENPIYEEMNHALQEMKKGIPELEVYEQFGIRTGLVSYKKLMALFISYKTRGSTNLLEAMNAEMLQAWETQKRKTRQQGEKIGTKLLFPMMGMLAVVFIMILVPAFLSFQL